MKRLFYCVATLVVILFSASCQRENLDPVSGGNVASYTIQLPGALSTRVIGENVSEVTQLVYEVYRTEATSKDDHTKNEVKLFQKEAVITNGTAEVEFELVNNQNFRVLFWAQVPDNGVYNTSSLKEVSVAQALTANAEKYAAFAGADYIKAGDDIVGREIELVRPVAQLNIGTDAESLSIEGQTTVKIATTAVTVKGLSTSFNVAENKAGEISTADYVYSEAPLAETAEYPGLSEETFLAGGTRYNYVAMNYVGFAPENGTNIKVTYTINTENVGTIVNTINNVPVRANHRTNIIGNLITSKSDYKVTLENQWEDDSYNVEYVSVATAEDLQEAINDIEEGTSGNIKLDGNIDLGALAGLISTKASVKTFGLLIPYGKSIVLDLNGNTLSQEVNQTSGYSMIQNNGTLTILDSKGEGKISYKDSGNGGNYVSNTITNYGTLTVKSGIIENITSEAAANVGYAYTIDTSIWGEAPEVVVNIEGGTLKSVYSPLRLCAASVTKEIVANISGGEIYGRIDHQMSSSKAGVKATLNISGGIFKSFGIKPDHSIKIFGAGLDTDASGMVLNITGGRFEKTFDIDRGSYVPLGKGFNEKFITGGEFKFDPTSFVADGYPVISPDADGYYTIGQFVAVAMIGDKEYGSLRSAVDAVEENGTISLIKDIEQLDGVIIEDKKNITIDLNDKIFTVSEGANTNNRNFKIIGSSVVTIMNGTMVAKGDYSSGAYGTVRTEGSSNVALKNVKLYNYRGNGLNIKATSGTCVTIEDSEVYSSYGGGIEAAGGEVVLNNVFVEQKGMYTAPYNSMAISVNGGGKVIVNSGTYSTECITAEEANGQGTSHGPWVAGVLNSGGTLVINGGTFSNDNFGDNSLATYARGLLLADTGANVEIYGGSFTALKSIIDIQNNLGDASRNPSVTISGGTFSSDPLTWDGLIRLSDGCFMQENAIGTYSVYNGVAVDSAEELIAALKNVKANPTIYLTSDITVTEKWDRRYTGATTSVPVVIDGMNHTLKFACEINEGFNYHAAFRFENEAEVRNLTFDLSEATAPGRWLRVISSAGDLNVDNCTFIGSDIETITTDNAVVVGDSNVSAQINASAIIANCIFINWRRGVSDNENTKELKSVTLDNNKFTSANVYISAYENVTFTGNIMSNSCANITSYTSAATAKVTAIDNTLDTNQYNIIGSAGKVFSIENVNAQEGFIVNAK